MKELSVFVDESGNYGGQSAKYYLVTLVFHDQSAPVVEIIERYERALRERGLPDIPLHMNPLMHGNESYGAMSTRLRSRLLASFATFYQQMPRHIHNVQLPKKQVQKRCDHVRKNASRLDPLFVRQTSALPEL